MSPLMGFQKRHLRGLANTLKPVVSIGKNGFNTEVKNAIEEALDSRELIKVRFLDFKEQRKELAVVIEQQCECQLAGMVGHVAIFFRRNKDAEKQTINLPTRS